jgi:hypothetical protein
MTAIHPPATGRGRVGRPLGHPRWFAAWARILTVLLGLLFTSVTALTVTLWVTDPGYAETNPVLDLAFFALGGVLITGGIATQLHRPQVAGVQQSLLGLASLALAGLVGGRIEPLVGGVGLLAAVAVLVALHPDRRRLLATGAGPSWPLLALTGTLALPALVYAMDMLGDARVWGPSCFLGQCAGGDRLAEAGALALTVVLVALLASLRTDGWPVPAWSAGLAAMTLGATSLALPDVTGALPLPSAVGAVAWGLAFLLVARRQAREGRSEG